MAIKGNIVKKEKSVFSFTFNGENADYTLRADDESVGINKGSVPSFWRSQEKYLKNDIVCSSTAEGIKLFRALNEVSGDIPPEEDEENWKIFPYQFYSDYAKKARYDTFGNEISESYVKKEEGKGLSENNFTDEYINEIDENTNARHSHENLNVLEKVTSELLTSGIKTVSCESEEEVAELAISGEFRAYQVSLKTTTTISQNSVSELTEFPQISVITPSQEVTQIETFLLFNDLKTETIGGFSLSGNSYYSQLKLSNDGIFKRTITAVPYTPLPLISEISAWEEIYDLSPYAKTEELSAYALKTELSDYVKKEDFRGANSLSYFFANNYNNGLFGSIETAGALFADYIFKENSMTEIAVDLSGAVSMVGGFLNSAVESVSFTNGTANLKKATSLFKGCNSLESITGVDLSGTDSVKYLFMNCEKLTGTLEIETQATDLSYLLYGCKAVTGLKLKAPNATLMTGCFTNCDSLSELEILGDMDFSLLFKALPKVSSGTITAEAEISDEIKAIATEKGWSFNG